MKKTDKKNLTLIITLVLVLVILAGMILATLLLSNVKYNEWEYYDDNKSTDYYSDDSSFAYVSDFSSALQNYLKSDFLQNIGFNDKVKFLTDRIIAAMQDANVPAARLGYIARVINENKLSAIFSGIEFPFEDLDGLADWLDSMMLSIGENTFFSIIGSFINKFFEITTLTEEEFSSFLFSYLSLYSSSPYKEVLRLYGRENIVSLFSDTFFAVRMLSRTNDTLGKNVSMYSLRTALFQLGRFYLDIAKIGDLFTFEKIFGLPDEFPSTNHPEIKDEIDKYYSDVRGSFGSLFSFFGYLLTVFEEEDLSAYADYMGEYKKNYAKVTILSEKKSENLLEPDEEAELNYLLDSNARYRICSAQKMSKAVSRAMELYSDKDSKTVINSFRDKLLSMRYLLFIISDSNENSYKNYLTYKDMIEKDSQDLIDSIAYFADKNYSYSEVLAMDNISELASFAAKFDAGTELIELYVSSVFNIWLTNKANDWGLIKHE